MFDVSDERILACLAACQGVPTESLKTGLLAELLESSAKLLRAGDNSNACSRACDEVRAVLAKAKGA